MFQMKSNQLKNQQFSSKNHSTTPSLQLSFHHSTIWCLKISPCTFSPSIVYGARTVTDLVYKYELDEWSKRPDVKLVTTVDPGGETPEWKGEIGFVPTVLERLAPRSENTIAIVCGPPVMIKFTFPVLTK